MSGAAPLTFAALLTLCAVVGCRSSGASAAPAREASAGLAATAFVASVDARCAPPLGWMAEPLKKSDRHTHQVWLSPSGKTAYGVIRFSLPLPVGPDPVLWAFLREMRQREGEAALISKRRDRDLPGIRFMAEGGQYVVRTNLITRGFRGWAIYAGALRGQAVVPEELHLAEQAREHTQIGTK